MSDDLRHFPNEGLNIASQYTHERPMSDDLAARHAEARKRILSSLPPWVHPEERVHAEAHAEVTRAALAELEAECERHRRANLLRRIMMGGDLLSVDEWIVDCINEGTFDSVPWKLAQHWQSQAAEQDRLRAFVEHIADLPIADGPHVALTCGCPIHQAERFIDWRTG